MRVLIRIAQDAGGGDAVAADLSSDVAVEILRRDDGYFSVGSVRYRQGGQSKEKRSHNPNEPLHGDPGFSFRNNADIHKCNIITFHPQRLFRRWRDNQIMRWIGGASAATGLQRLKFYAGGGLPI